LEVAVPWRNPDLVTIREEFIQFALSGRHHITEACVVFGISEKTGHKWLNRYRDEGRKGLGDRSHVPHFSVNQVSSEVRKRIVDFRSLHPKWGARKLKANLTRKHPHTLWPAASTIGELLRREGLSKPRRNRHQGRAQALDSQLTVASYPNHVWSTDFKGEFKLGSGPYCFPLTVQDYKSRFLIECRALSSTSGDSAKIVFSQIFERFGMPDVMRSDNGVPFAHALALARLSALSVWWIRLGIRPERIEPGQPQQNGQHERMHRTLKDEATRPPSMTLVQQQKRFDHFRREYNEERPHESLGQNPPSDFYRASERPFPRELPEMSYPTHYHVRRVERSGMVTYRGHRFWLTKSLSGEDVGLEETDNDLVSVNFGQLCLGTYHLPSNTFIAECVWRTNDTPQT
jgi:transposase InsO family protein